MSANASDKLLTSARLLFSNGDVNVSSTADPYISRYPITDNVSATRDQFEPISGDNNTEATTDEQFVPRSGYDFPVFGMEDGTFVYLHSLAIGCLITSFICAIITLVLSFRNNNSLTFFSKWSRSERYVVYMAICDGVFNFWHTIEHVHGLAVFGHVRPKELCAFYGFMVTVFIGSQNLLVNVIAISVFFIIYFDKNINFGQRDWKLLLYCFGVPFVGAVAAAAGDQFGPRELFCAFDQVKGRMSNFLFNTIPIIIITAVNIILYILAWKRIRDEARETKQVLGNDNSHIAIMKRSHRAARNMSMFVVAFFAQWSGVAVHAVCGLVTPHIHMVLYFLIVFFANIGGLLNLIVFLIIRKSRNAQRSPDNRQILVFKSSNVTSGTKSMVSSSASRAPPKSTQKVVRC
ncbi:uncharacterized protein LOC127840756 [Dreissena polymorpha]|nr:uncharacterized protein LOC127840756 [Dreissena polymorpha]